MTETTISKAHSAFWATKEKGNIMGDEPVTVSYKGTDIVYNEESNRWEFTLHGIERVAITLLLAKARIDAPPKDPKKNTFPRTECWTVRYGEIKKVVATSVARGRWGQNNHCWTSSVSKTGRAEREQISADSLYPVGEKNDKMIKQMLDMMKRRKDLNEAIDLLQKKLVCLALPETDEEEN